MKWFNIPFRAWNDIKDMPLSNCSAISIEKDKNGKWQATMLYDGDDNKKVNIDVLKDIPTRNVDLADLPKLPVFLKKKKL